MISKREIKEIRALAQKKFRDESGLFVVEGEKLVAEALQSGYEVVKLFRTEEIGEEEMARISLLTHPSPALAVVRKPAETVFVPPTGELILALDSLRDPGNVGTILRIADWFGIRTVLASPDTVEIYNPKVVQATMGAIFRVHVHICPLPETLAGLRRAGLPVYGTFLQGNPLYGASLARAGVIVLGSERDGISPAVEAVVSERLYIPPFPPGEAPGPESLNVATAAAIVCGEFRRRFITP
ncbi:MAG: RNA methyltransferase [Bacteroidales bacterium]|nr:RNA methyltransferase [Bacteroidales bacterium]